MSNEDLRKATKDMMKACTLASEMMMWISEKNPPIEPKQATQAMIVAIAIMMRANRKEKKLIREGAKLVGEMIQDVADMLDDAEIPT